MSTCLHEWTKYWDQVSKDYPHHSEDFLEQGGHIEKDGLGQGFRLAKRAMLGVLGAKLKV